MTKIKRKDDPYVELARRIKKVWNDKEFFIGIASAVETEDKCRELLAFMDENPDATAENIMVYALQIE